MSGYGAPRGARRAAENVVAGRWGTPLGLWTGIVFFSLFGSALFKKEIHVRVRCVNIVVPAERLEILAVRSLLKRSDRTACGELCRPRPGGVILCFAQKSFVAKRVLHSSSCKVFQAWALASSFNAPSQTCWLEKLASFLLAVVWAWTSCFKVWEFCGGMLFILGKRINNSVDFQTLGFRKMKRS